jgi:hypothetical protein
LGSIIYISAAAHVRSHYFAEVGDLVPADRLRPAPSDMVKWQLPIGKSK